MTYLKAYFSAFLDLFKIASMIFFSLSLLSANSGIALLFIYLTATAAFAGPIKASMVHRSSLE